MGCVRARMTDKYHGWECEGTDGPCLFLNPDHERCVKEEGDNSPLISDPWDKVFQDLFAKVGEKK